MMIGLGEAMGLIAHELEEPERTGTPGKAQRPAAPFHKNLLFPFG
jgi:hypothetical protein